MVADVEHFIQSHAYAIRSHADLAEFCLDSSSSGKGKKDYMRLSYLISTAINKVSTWDVWLEVRHGQSSGYVHVSQDPELYPGIWTFAIMPSFVDYTRPDKGL